MVDQGTCAVAWKRRVFAGVAGSFVQRRIRAAAVEFSGPGFETRAHLLSDVSCEVDEDPILKLAKRVPEGSPISSEAVAIAAEQLAASQIAAIQRLSQSLHREPEPPLAVGVSDSCVCDRSGVGLPLAAPALAEATSWNVIDDFANRDRAQNGHGGPILAKAYWVLLRDPKRDRILVDLAGTIRVTYLPAGCEAVAASRVFAMDVAPGTDLLVAVARRWLPELATSPDALGKASAQGHQEPSLAGELLEHAVLPTDPPAYHPGGLRADEFLEPLARAFQGGQLRPVDLLSTATCFIAAAIARCLNKHVPQAAARPEILLHGTGRHNGMLTRLIHDALDRVTPRDIDESGITSEALEAAAAAVMAQLWADQVPQSGMFISGSAAPRVLGRVTPGSPQNWRRLVAYLAAAAPASVPLRSAV